MEQIEVYDGINFTSLDFKSIDKNNYVRIIAYRDDGRSWEVETELYSTKNNQHYIMLDYPVVYSDIKKIFVDNEVVCCLQNQI